MASPIMNHFNDAHLKDGPLKATFREFAELARKMDGYLPDGAEKTVALRKLLEAKDSAMRAAVDLTIVWESKVRPDLAVRVGGVERHVDYTVHPPRGHLTAHPMAIDRWEAEGMTMAGLLGKKHAYIIEDEIQRDEREFGANGDQALQNIVDRRYPGDIDMDRPPQS